MAEELSTSDIKAVTIISYPKIIFFWPTMVISLIAGLMSHLGYFVDRHDSKDKEDEPMVVDNKKETGSSEAPATAQKPLPLKGRRTLGLIWITVFAMNLCVIAYEFSRIKFIATIMGMIMMILAAFLANTHWAFFEFLGKTIRGINIQANHSFYYGITLIFIVLFIAVKISTGWNYYVVENNMILHYHGFMGDVHRYPAPNLRMSKEITDIFEYCLGLSGTLILHPSNESRAIVLENVLGINRKEERIKRLLGSLQVSIRK
ncbi:MAG: hypothetical protein AABZ60_02615 [Planctomycetota bacterium]